MSFAPPSGPPLPSVPEGWTTQFDDTYKQWFFINLATGRSQWEPPQFNRAPTPPPMPAQAQASEQPHAGQPAVPPPSYEESGPGNSSAVAGAADSEKKRAHPFSSNNPYNVEAVSTPGTSGTSGHDNIKSTVESDAELAARLQAEEDARSGSAAPGAAAGYYGNSTPYSLTPSSSTGDKDKGKEKKKGFFSKLMSKATSASSPGHGYVGRPPHHQQAAYGYSPHGGYGAPSPGPGFGAPSGYYPPQQVYGPGVGYGPGYGPQPGYGYPQQAYYGGGMRPQRRQGGGGMGMAGAAALGVGGGLVGGALLADAIDDDHDHGDYGGGDDFGGDF
ncbi:hypothetical protein BDW62DRAFT_188158 [Aspergillus aurantiobrunneus]